MVCRMYECGGARQNAPSNGGRTLCFSSPGKISPICGTSFAPPTAPPLRSIAVPVFHQSANLERHDYAYRKYAARLHNRLTSLIVGVPMHDYGCMLRAYRRHIVDTVVDCDEKASFVPALANTFAKRVAEIPVGHEVRAGGESKYDLFGLAKLSLNLITGFSLIPIQALSLTGIGIFILDAILAAVVLGHRLIYGPQEEGALWTLFAILFFFVGMIFLALGLIA